MPEPETIRRAPPAVDTSAERLTELRNRVWEDLSSAERDGVDFHPRRDFNELLEALAVRQREAVSEALANWGGHSPACALLRQKTAVPGEPLPGCDCGFDDALDRLAPKEGW